MKHTTSLPTNQWAWTGALGCFILAGLTGALYRFGIAYGFSLGLDLTNIRHAHSHLMYLGWVTPALFALIARQVSLLTARTFPQKVWWVVGATFAAALLAYPLFLAYGYSSISIGTARMPLAAMAAGLNMIVWYFFVGLYIRTTRGVQRTRPLLLWDMSLVFLVIASLGAWSLSMLKPLGFDDPVVANALTHVFLDLFSEGWFVLAVLGLAFASLKPEGDPAGHWSLWLICIGLPVTFALGMPASFVSPPLKIAAKVGSALVAIGFFMNLQVLWKALSEETSRWWRIPLALLALKLFAQLFVSIVPGVWWAELQGLRILYLHLMLLGFVSLGLVATASHVWSPKATQSHKGLVFSILLVFISLIPLTVVWPEAWSGRWAFTTASWIALGPVLLALLMAWKARGTSTHVSP